MFRITLSIGGVAFSPLVDKQRGGRAGGGRDRIKKMKLPVATRGSAAVVPEVFPPLVTFIEYFNTNISSNYLRKNKGNVPIKRLPPTRHHHHHHHQAET
jgi:hypothetical protein